MCGGIRLTIAVNDLQVSDIFIGNRMHYNAMYYSGFLCLNALFIVCFFFLAVRFQQASEQATRPPFGIGSRLCFFFFLSEVPAGGSLRSSRLPQLGCLLRTKKLTPSIIYRGSVDFLTLLSSTHHPGPRLQYPLSVVVSRSLRFFFFTSPVPCLTSALVRVLVRPDTIPRAEERPVKATNLTEQGSYFLFAA